MHTYSAPKFQVLEKMEVDIKSRIFPKMSCEHLCAFNSGRMVMGCSNRILRYIFANSGMYHQNYLRFLCMLSFELQHCFILLYLHLVLFGICCNDQTRILLEEGCVQQQ